MPVRAPGAAEAAAGASRNGNGETQAADPKAKGKAKAEDPRAEETEDEGDEHAWRVFHVPEQLAKKRGIVAVNVAEVSAGGEPSAYGPDVRAGRRWWKVLAKGVARARKRGNAT